MKITVSTLVTIVIGCVTLMGMFSIFAGVYLTNRGHEAGEILIQGGGIAVISGLMGVLGALIGRHFQNGNKD